MLQDTGVPNRRVTGSVVVLVAAAATLAILTVCTGRAATADKEDSTGGALGTGLGTVSPSKTGPTSVNGGSGTGAIKL
jgi:hypothetical protein